MSKQENVIFSAIEPLDWIGRAVLFSYKQETLKGAFGVRCARVSSVVVHESEPLELGLDCDHVEYVTEREVVIHAVTNGPWIKGSPWPFPGRPCEPLAKVVP